MSPILFGFKRCGKTTYGKLLAQKLGLPFVDTDHLIEETYGKNCRQIVEEKGVEEFRALERETILSLRASKKQIIALGAGAILSADNVSHLRQLGQFLYLRLDRQTLFNRQIEPPLPYYIDAEDPAGTFDAIYCQRIPQYEKLASSSLDLEGKTPQEILCQLIDLATSFASQHGENPMAKQ